MKPQSLLQRIALAWVAHATLAGAFALLAFVPAPVLAVNSNTEVKLTRIASQRVEAKYGRASPEWRQDVPRTAVPGSAAGSMVLVDTFKGPSPKTGDFVDVEVKRVIPWSSAARGVSNALPFVSTAVALLELTESIRCREGFGLTWECDEGTPPAENTVARWCLVNGGASNPGNCNGVGLNDATSYQQAGEWRRINRGAATVTYEVVNPSYVIARYYNSGGGYLGGDNIAIVGTVVTVGCTGGATEGADGKCPTGTYVPKSPADVADLIEEFGDKDSAPDVVPELSDENVPLDHDFPDIDPQTPVQGGRETTTNPDGSTTVKDIKWDLQGQDDGYTWTPTITEKTYPPGATIPPPGQITDGTSTTGGGAPTQEVITCGLPDTPACKIDETDTPEEVEDTSETDVQGVMAPILEAISDPASVFGEFPTINWTFALPTGCGVIPLAAFAPYLTGIDICQFQPIFHDVMAVVWVLGALFGGIGIFWRDQLAT